MHKLSLENRIDLLALLGKHLRDSTNPGLEEAIYRAKARNEWFHIDFSKNAVESWGKTLTKENLNNWVADYSEIFNTSTPKKVGLILAGNLPLVGLHDIVSVFISGNQSLIKASSQDETLIKYVANYLMELEPAVGDYIQFSERLDGFDAVIATGSDNSSRYFDHYFGKYPHIIRQNRNSIAVISPDDTQEDFEKLSKDVFTYFGLGCRNVSTIFLPKSVKMESLLDSFMSYEKVMDCFKYKNNYDYTKTIFLLNNIPHLDTGFMIFNESKELSPRLASVNYFFYDDLKEVNDFIEGRADKIQCVASNNPNIPFSVPIGTTQEPGLEDYADRINTLDFLKKLA